LQSFDHSKGTDKSASDMLALSGVDVAKLEKVPLGINCSPVGQVEGRCSQKTVCCTGDTYEVSASRSDCSSRPLKTDLNNRFAQNKAVTVEVVTIGCSPVM
jgi:hypothetical protein